MNEDTGLYYIGNFSKFMSYLKEGLFEGISAKYAGMGHYRLRWGGRILEAGHDINLRELGIEDNAELTLEHVPYESREAPTLTYQRRRAFGGLMYFS